MQKWVPVSQQISDFGVFILVTTRSCQHFETDHFHRGGVRLLYERDGMLVVLALFTSDRLTENISERRLNSLKNLCSNIQDNGKS